MDAVVRLLHVFSEWGRRLQTGICEMDSWVERRVGWWDIGLWSKEREEFLVDVDAEGTDGEDVASEMEFAVLEGGKEERWVDVGLDDEVAELRYHDAVFRIGRRGRFSGFRAVGIRGIGFPFVEDGSQFLFAAEEPDALAPIAHAGLEDPPLAIF